MLIVLNALTGMIGQYLNQTITFLFMFLNNYIISCLRMIFNQYFSFKEFRKMPLLKYDEGNETVYQNQNCNFKVARKVA